jgi:hypothetical protein
MPNELADASLAQPSAAPMQPLAEQQAAAAPAQSAPLPSPLDAVAAGQIPAISLSAFDEANPLHEFLVQNFEALPQLGLDYADLEGEDNLSVVFNPKIISEEKLQEAHKAGQLDQIAPRGDATAEAAPAPSEAAAAAPAEAVAAPTEAPLASQDISAPPANRALQNARTRNMQAINAPAVNKPTGGPAAAMARRAV